MRVVGVSTDPHYDGVFVAVASIDGRQRPPGGARIVGTRVAPTVLLAEEWGAPGNQWPISRAEWGWKCITGSRVIRLVEALPANRTADVIGKQLLRFATSVGANYRAARRAKSPADFVAKMKIVEEEAAECVYWLELLAESGLVAENRLTGLLTEGNALVAMTVAAIKTVRSQKL